MIASDTCVLSYWNQGAGGLFQSTFFSPKSWFHIPIRWDLIEHNFYVVSSLLILEESAFKHRADHERVSNLQSRATENANRETNEIHNLKLLKKKGEINSGHALDVDDKDSKYQQGSVQKDQLYHEAIASFYYCGLKSCIRLFK